MKSKCEIFRKCSWLTIMAVVILSNLAMAPGRLFASNYDYYASTQNPPVTENDPPYATTHIRLENDLLSIYISLPRQMPMTSKKYLRMGVSYRMKRDDVKRIGIEKFSLRDGRYGNISLVQVDGKSERALERELDRSPTLTYRVKDYQTPFDDLSIEIKVTAFTDSGSETIEKTIPLYRGKYTVSTMRELGMRWGK